MYVSSVLPDYVVKLVSIKEVCSFSENEFFFMHIAKITVTTIMQNEIRLIVNPPQ
jgi:hypothetical protein